MVLKVPVYLEITFRDDYYPKDLDLVEMTRDTFQALLSKQEKIDFERSWTIGKPSWARQLPREVWDKLDTVKVVPRSEALKSLR